MRNREPMSKKRIAGIFFGWLLFCGLFYALGIQRQWVWVLYVYGGIVLLGAVMFLLVNGGIGPLRDKPGENPRLVVFRMHENTRVFWAQVLMVVTVPPVLVLLGDYCLIMIQTFF